MDVITAIERRKSVRRYTEDTVTDEDLEAVLDAARQAPSWKNMQCARYIVIRDRQEIEAIAANTSETNQKWLAKVPVVIAVCADPQDSGHLNDQAYYLVDCAIAMDHLMLRAVELGLGTCWVGVFDEMAVKNILKISERIKIVGMTSLGKPLDSPDAVRPTVRKKLDELVSFKYNSTHK